MKIDCKAYFEILRPVNGIMASIAVVLGAVIGGAAGVEILLAAISAFLISGAGMVINDYYDVKIDKVNRPARPLPSGRISMRAVAIYAGVLFGLGVGLSLFFNIAVIALAVGNSVLEILYAWRIKRLPLLGNVLVSWLVGSTYIYGALLTGQLFGASILAGVAFFANMAREVYKTATDYEGDRKGGARTVAVVLGSDRAKRLGDSFAILASLLSIALFVYGIFGLVYLVIQLVAVTVYASALFASASVAEKRTKQGMVIGLVAIAAELAGKLF